MESMEGRKIDIHKRGNISNRLCIKWKDSKRSKERGRSEQNGIKSCIKGNRIYW